MLKGTGLEEISADTKKDQGPPKKYPQMFRIRRRKNFAV
jgi:hypothetical protein